MKLYITTILFVVFAFSCSGQKNIGFEREIPEGYNGKHDLFYELTQQKVKQLKIESLQNGYDSLQIRIWSDYSLQASRKLLIIKRTNSTWTVTLYSMSVDWDPYKLTETVKSKKVKKLIPKNGWDSFLTTLFSYQITTLPNMEDISGLEDNWTDGASYHVEVATTKQYRFYSYHLPNKFQDQYWQARNVVDILTLLESEFAIEL
jgi:hypothetical protein